METPKLKQFICIKYEIQASFLFLLYIIYFLLCRFFYVYKFYKSIIKRCQGVLSLLLEIQWNCLVDMSVEIFCWIYQYHFVIGGVYGSAVAALFPVPAGQMPLIYALRLVGINGAFFGMHMI